MLPLALLALPSPEVGLYSRIGDLKEPDWDRAASLADAGFYERLEDLKTPDWALPAEPGSELASAAAEDLYFKIGELKNPY